MSFLQERNILGRDLFSHALFLSVFCSLFVLSPEAVFAMGEVRRYAVVVGNNLGEPQEVELRYAERDAKRVANTLEKFGQIPRKNIMRLNGVQASQLQATLQQIEQRIQKEKQANPQHEYLLIVYYSGHADQRTLHMAGTRYKFKDLKRTLKSSRADMKLVIIDACHSGELTRVKGAKPAKPFALNVVERSSSKGVAIITSSSGSEDAQESDRLQGSFFTHHLLAGLLGAADSTRDGRVSLSEAYQYAYTETLRATSRMRHIQHPTYLYQVRGRKDVTLTFLDKASSKRWGRLKLSGKGFYMMFDRNASGRLVTEIAVDRTSEMVMEPGRYFVRYRHKSAVYESSLDIVQGKTFHLRKNSMKRVPYAQVVRKGSYGDDAPAQTLSMLVGGVYSAPVIPNTENLWAGVLGAQLDTRLLSYQLRFRYGSSETSNEYLRMTQHAYGITLGALALWDIGPVGFGLGARAGADFMQQNFVSVSDTPPRQNLRWRIGGVGQVVWNPIPWLGIYGEGAIDLSLLPLLQNQDETSWTAHAVPYASLGVQLFWP